jgi:hypothetical protein
MRMRKVRLAWALGCMFAVAGCDAGAARDDANTEPPPSSGIGSSGGVAPATAGVAGSVTGSGTTGAGGNASRPGDAGASDADVSGGVSAGSGAGGALSAGGAGGEGGTAIAAGTGGATGVAGAAGSPAVEPVVDESCLQGITDYAAAGPFAFEPLVSRSVKLWIPDVPAGCQVPVVHFANGTGAACSTYQPVLDHLASHGFLVTCFENSTTGAGLQCVTAIETARAEHPQLASHKVGFGGHQTGGGSALMCAFNGRAKWGPQPRITAHGSEPDLAGIASGWMAAYAQIQDPIFIFNGSEDGLVSESLVRQHMDALPTSIEAFWYEGVGAPHIPVPVPWINESMVAWFRWKLLDDADACEHVYAMPEGDDWDLQDTRNPSGC